METLATIIYYTCWRQVDRFQYLFQQPKQNPYKKETLWKPHCVTQIGCWYSAWCCWCCAFFATSTQEESKQSVPFQPTTLREKNDDKICVRKHCWIYIYILMMVYYCDAFRILVRIQVSVLWNHTWLSKKLNLSIPYSICMILHAIC